jgi:hypothetical protein
MSERMSWICGIDYSTHAIDVVYLDENNELPPRWARHQLEGQDAWERTRMVRYWQFREDNVLAVGLEQPRGHGAGHLYRIQGALLCRLPQNVLVQPWLPNEWRKRVGLPGNAKKPDSVARSSEILFESGPGGFSYVDWPIDAHEAHLIACATRDALTIEATA